MSYRNLDINGRNWRFKIGASFLDIRNPEGKGYRPTHEQVTGVSPYDDVKLPIGPKLVREWIEKNAV